jgi:FKBP-type peptidyl-prolyl cis-trans isomerase FkpA
MKHIFHIIITLLLVSCAGDVHERPQISAKELQEQLLQANIKAATMESDQIDAYAKRMNLKVITSPTGLRYDIYNDMEGENILTNQKAVVKYKVSLLNGTECYATGDDVEEFVVGKDYVESGLHEGITYMSKGDKATIIIPSHLAHGLVGDFKKIPLRSTIVYDIELVDIK